MCQLLLVTPIYLNTHSVSCYFPSSSSSYSYWTTCVELIWREQYSLRDKLYCVYGSSIEKIYNLIQFSVDIIALWQYHSLTKHWFRLPRVSKLKCSWLAIAARNCSLTKHWICSTWCVLSSFYKSEKIW